MIDGVDVFYRESPHPTADARVMAHIHGFGLSGRYLLPTAERLADEFHTYVPDLPGFGRSGKKRDMLDIPDLAHAAADFLEDRGVARASLVGNSMGCPVIIEFAHRYPERIERAVLVSPAGGLFNQPLRRAMGQLSRDAPREPTRMARVAVPDYVRFGVPSTVALFKALTQYPSLERLLEMRIPTLVVLGERDPLLPGSASHQRDRQSDRQPRARRAARGRRARHQLQPSRPARARHPAFHGRPADRERPVVAGRRARLRGSPRQASSAARRRDLVARQALAEHATKRSGSTTFAGAPRKNPATCSGRYPAIPQPTSVDEEPQLGMLVARSR